MGHSNGGFMSYRMACEAADVVTAIASLAGATFATAAECSPSQPVSALQIHGVDDATILFAGGEIIGEGYPSAAESVRRMAAAGGCDLDAPTGLADVDILLTGGDDTSVLLYETGCAPGVDAELWTMPATGHIPPVSGDFSPAVLDWLFRHRR